VYLYSKYHNLILKKTKSKMQRCYIIYILLLYYQTLVFPLDEGFFGSARMGHIEKLTEYIRQGFDVSSRDSKGNTAIIIAAGRGHVHVINTLLSFGANPEDATIGGLFDGKTSLMWAVSQVRESNHSQ
jgi:Ankyrin repeats (3 copies)